MTGDADDVADPSEAFAAVASERRFGVLQALWDRTDGSLDPVSFSDLRREAGVEDSGQFNYHLEQLQPRFVRKVDGGYRLTEAGRRVVGAAASGVYTDSDASLDPQPVGDCVACDGTLVLDYEEGIATVECRDCGTLVTDMPVPPVLVATHDPEEVPDVVARHILTEVQRMHRGLCLYCGGPMAADVQPISLSEFSEGWNVSFECETCGNRSASVVAAAVVDHPAVASLFADAGIDVRETPLWELDAVLTATEEVVGEDPVEFEVTIETDAGAVVLTVDEDLDVVAADRRDAGE